jgi:hypothetical protein
MKSLQSIENHNLAISIRFTSSKCSVGNGGLVEQVGERKSREKDALLL